MSIKIILLMRIKWLFLSLAVCFCSYAQQENKSQIAFTAAFGATDQKDFCYQFEISYYYMRHPLMGIGCGIGFCGILSDHLPFGYSENGIWTSWYLNKEYKYINQPYIRPSLIFRSPALTQIKGKYGVYLQAEPGVQLLIPYSYVKIDYINDETYIDYSERISSNKGNWCFWNLKSCILIRNNDVSFGLGYIISNLDVYSKRRTMKIENTSFDKFYPKTKLTHNAFIYVGISF